MGEGIGHHKKSLVGGKKYNLYEQQEVGPIAKVEEEILEMISEVSIESYGQQNWCFNQVKPVVHVKENERVGVMERKRKTNQGRNQGSP